MTKKELTPVKPLPTLDNKVQVQGSEMLSKYREEYEQAKKDGKSTPPEPKLPEGFVGMKQGQFMVWSTVNELVSTVNELVSVVNKLQPK